MENASDSSLLREDHLKTEPQAPKESLSPSNDDSPSVRKPMTTPTAQAIQLSSDTPATVTAPAFQLATPNKHFSYPGLDSPANHFRLIELQPAAEFSADIKCCIRNTQLQDAHYEALSYTWGDSNTTTPILLAVLDGTEDVSNPKYVSFHVTVNLERALRSLRWTDRKRVIWADAICIDQSNLVERGQQVRLMGRIYRGCVQDLLWLGPDDAQTIRAMKLFPRLQGCLGDGQQLQASKSEDMEITFSNFSEDDWEDFEALCRNSVWQRIWIVQELIFSPAILLVCGQHTLSWDIVNTMMLENNDVQAMADRPGPISERILASVGTLSTIYIHRLPQNISDQTRGMAKTLLSVVFWFFHWKASDSRDKVYAVLNLIPNGELLDIDYHKTGDQLSIDFAKACIKEAGRLQILSHSTAHRVSFSTYLKDSATKTSAAKRDAETTGKTPRGRTETDIERTLPTWVPDLSKVASLSATVSGLSLQGFTRYNACGPRSISNYSISPTLRLTVDGVRVDALSLVNDVSPISANESARDRWVRDVRRWAPENVSCRTRYTWTPNRTESSLTAYWRTIVTDRLADKRLSQQHLGDNVNTYLEIDEGREVPEELLVLTGWRFGMTKMGMYCMLPPQAREGDIVVVLYGSEVPLLLRRNHREEEGQEVSGDALYELVGEAYVHCMMDGMVIPFSEAPFPTAAQVFQKMSFVII